MIRHEATEKGLLGLSPVHHGEPWGLSQGGTLEAVWRRSLTGKGWETRRRGGRLWPQSRR